MPSSEHSSTRSATPHEPASRHNQEIAFNRGAWDRKPSLRAIYRSFHERIARCLTGDDEHLIVELGSGIGAIKAVIPRCVTTDIHPNPWLDQEEDAYALSFGDQTVSDLILFDVWHHLEFPGAALQEFQRVLTPHGRIILFEPAMSLVGKFVYGLLHPEPLGLRIPFSWQPPAGFDLRRAPYFAAQSSATRIFLWNDQQAWQRDWKIVSSKKIVSFSYLLSGGFSKRQLFPTSLLPVLQACDSFLQPLANLLAARLLIVLSKEPSTHE